MPEITGLSVPHLTAAILELNSRLDAGRSCSIEEVSARTRDASLFEWLRTLGVETLQLSSAEKAILLEVFTELDSSISSRRKFAVEQNGFSLVLAWLVEALQQCLAANGLYPV